MAFLNNLTHLLRIIERKYEYVIVQNNEAIFFLEMEQLPFQ